MRQVALVLLMGSAAVGLSLATSADHADARPNYNTEFKDLYVKPGTPLAQAVDKAKCGVCHGKSKKMRNAYGKALEDALGQAKVKNKGQIVNALEKAAKVHSDPADPKSPTFGELLEMDKLPAGE